MGSVNYHVTLVVGLGGATLGKYILASYFGYVYFAQILIICDLSKRRECVVRSTWKLERLRPRGRVGKPRFPGSKMRER